MSVERLEHLNQEKGRVTTNVPTNSGHGAHRFSLELLGFCYCSYLIYSMGSSFLSLFTFHFFNLATLKFIHFRLHSGKIMVRKILHMPDETNNIVDHHQLLVKKQVNKLKTKIQSTQTSCKIM